MMVRQSCSSPFGRQAAGLVAVSDPIKPSTPEALTALRQSGLCIVMLTGDNRRTADAVARKLPIDHVEAEALPEDKSAVVKAMQGEGRAIFAASCGHDGSVGRPLPPHRRRPATTCMRTWFSTWRCAGR
jgi:high-affinity K+ transport system ATPase subunit B